MPDNRTRQPDQYFRNPENSVGYLTRVVFRGFSRLLERRTLQRDISAGQWRFLRQLWCEDGVTQRELSDRVGMREPTTVVALKSLEAGNLIRREKSRTDRRKIHIYLTPYAKSLEAVLVPFNAEVHHIATAGMSDHEVETLQSLLRRVRDNLSQESANLPMMTDMDG